MMRKEGFDPRQDNGSPTIPNNSYVLKITFPGITDTIQSVWFTLMERRGKRTSIYVTTSPKKGISILSDWKLL